MEQVDLESRGERTPIAVVEINAARHSIKAKTAREELSDSGMKAAVEAGASSGHHEEIMDVLNQGQTIDIHGSSRERTIQSSMLRLLSEHFKDVDFSQVDPKELVDWIIESGQIRVLENDLLNFKLGSGVFDEESLKAFTDKKYLKWIIEDSDKRAVETGQVVDQVETFSTQAANVALFLETMGFEKAKEIVHSGGGREHVFITSHKGVLESFLYKVITLKSGEEKAKEFVKSLADEDGFVENQGFKLTFEMFEGEDWKITIPYEDQVYILDANDLGKIIKEGIDLREQLSK